LNDGTIIQTGLFEQTEYTPSLHILKDGKPVDWSFEQIFDASTYTELFAVTYVASPRFFFERTSDFKKIQLILGIADPEQQHQMFSALVDQKKRLEDWHSLPNEIQDRILEERYHIRYPLPNTVIHSKFYLLHSPETELKRVVVGSANFTPNALIQPNQYEELLIFDDPSLYDCYLERFFLLKAKTEDYIPAPVRRKGKEAVNLLLIQDPDTQFDLLRDEFAKLNHREIAIPEEVMNRLEEEPRELAKAQEVADQVSRLVKLTTKSENGTKKLISVKQLVSKKQRIQAFLAPTYHRKEHLDPRPLLVADKGNNRLYLKSTDSDEALLFSRPADTETIREQLQLIHDFVESNRLFTIKGDLTNQKRVFEAILYAFTSPFIWKMREHLIYSGTGEASQRYLFRPIMVLAGRASSGKTTILKFIADLIGGYTGTDKFLSFSKLKRSDGIQPFMETEFVAPVLVDELTDTFFTGQAGERITKYLANDLEGVHPCLIGTTNADNFSMKAQMARRIYFLMINSAFDPKRFDEAEEYLANIKAKLTTDLFRDFTYRLAERIRNDQPFAYKKDFLQVAREIFQEYYEETTLSKPSFFPDQPINDYYERGKKIWANLYTERKKAFTVRKNELRVKMDDLIKDPKDQKINISYLPPDVVIEETGILVLDKKRFFSFIGVKRRWF